MGFQWWGLTLEDSCREKSQRREPPLLVSPAPPLLWLCCIRTLLVTHSPLRKIPKQSRSDLEVPTSTAGAADRSVSTEQEEGLTLCESNREGCSPCAELRKACKLLQQNLSCWGRSKDSNENKLYPSNHDYKLRIRYEKRGTTASVWTEIFSFHVSGCGLKVGFPHTPQKLDQ